MRVAPLSRSGAAFADLCRFVRDDIFNWCRALRFEPTPQQVEILRDVQENGVRGLPTHISIKSGHGIGKTAVEGVIGSWKLVRRFLAKGVVTAPTMRQCQIWMGELRDLLRKAPPEVARLFDVQATRCRLLDVEGWEIKAATGTSDVNMQGFHNPYLFIIVDEASGVAREVFIAMLATMTNVEKMMLLCGNPNSRDSFFFDTHNKLSRHWSRHTMNAEESPLVDRGNLQQLADTFGRDSDVYRVRVLGEFPTQDPNCVMNTDDLEACGRVPLEQAARGSRDRQFGIDFARFGDDASVVYRRSGLAVVEQLVRYKTEPTLVIAEAFEMQKRAFWRHEDVLYVADAGGMGNSLMTFFRQGGRRLHEFHSGGVPADPSLYDDSITEAFFGLRDLVRARKIHLPDDPELVAELGNRQYYLTLEGKLKLESKDDYKARVQTGSPDRADACAMAFYDRTVTQSRVARADGPRRSQGPSAADFAAGKLLR